MKKIYKSLLIGLFALSFASCNKNNSSSTSSSLSNNSFTSSIEVTSSSAEDINDIVDLKINNYSSTLYYLEEFNDIDVTATLVYENGEEYEFTYESLTFDFSEFSNLKLGKQKITIGVYGYDITKDIEVEVLSKDSFNILMIGNSFSDDTIKWVYEICDDLDIEVQIANLYIGGCNLDTHYRNLLNNQKAYAFRLYNENKKEWDYTNTYNTSIEEALEYYDWDYVSLQQASPDSGRGFTYSKLDLIIDEILSIKDDVNFVWNMTWAYQQNTTHSGFALYNNDQITMYNMICEATQSKIISNEYMKAIIPNGTAIQNARTSFVGDNLTRDGYHLSNDFGRYIAGLCLVKTMTATDITNLSFIPNSLSNTHINVAVEAVDNAILNPFEVTESTYKEAPTVNLENHREIDYQPVGCAYYNSEDKNNYNKLITTASNSSKFIASKRFTKETLPIGSIIEIKSGYQYRPEGWVEDTVQVGRESNVTTQFVEVTESWWGNYSIRGFNISKTNSESLTTNIKEAAEAFSIYLPKDLYIEEQNPFSANDSQLFENKSLDITNYEEYNYIYSTGYFNSSLYPDLTLTHTSEFSTKFLCTEHFTKETLPIGTVLIIDSGYYYRPDGWISSEINDNRPSNVTTNFVVIDASWWGEYTIRAFNITTANGDIINQVSNDVTNHFRIYLPK